MAKYITKPTIKEATQWFPDRIVSGVFHEGTDHYVITIHLQKTYLSPGDYVVTEPDGFHHYPVKPDIFEKNHEKLNS